MSKLGSTCLKAILDNNPPHARQSKQYQGIASREYEIFCKRCPRYRRNVSYIESVLTNLQNKIHVTDQLLDTAQGEYNKNGFVSEEKYVLSLIGAAEYRKLDTGRAQHTDNDSSTIMTSHSSRQPVTEGRDWKAASYKLRADNPNIANLSDPNRPTKLAELFSEIYDNNWTDAYEELSHSKSSRAETEKILLNIVVTAYNHCKAFAERQISDMVRAVDKVLQQGSALGTQADRFPNGDRGLLVQYRKDVAGQSVPQVKQSFSKNNGGKIDGAVKLYAEQCLEVSWWMCVQDPPVYMKSDFKSGAKFDKNLLRPYTKSGDKIDFLVWPSLQIAEGKAVLLKGVAQGK